MEKLLRLDELATGDILAFRGRGFWSRLIGLRTASRVSHVGVVFVTDVEGERIEQVVEAKEGRGVRQVALDDYLAQWSRIDVYRPGQIYRASVSWLLRQGQQGYAPWWQFVWSWGWLASWLRARCGLRIDLDSRSTHCSELASRFLVLNKIDIPYDPAAMSPADVVDLPIVHLGRIR